MQVHLPRSPSAANFLGTDGVFDEVHSTLSPGGLLHLSSNVEDVAVSMLERAITRGFSPLLDASQGRFEQVPTPRHRTRVGAFPTAPSGSSPANPLGTRAMSRRQELYRQMGGARAEGVEWDAGKRLLLDGGVLGGATSETELTYALEGRQTFRVTLTR